MWQIINRETGKTSHNNQQNELKYGTKQITDLQEIAELCNSHFTEIADKLLKQNIIINSSCKLPQHRINRCNETMLLFPVTEIEVEKVTKNLKGKFSSGTDKVPEHVVKQYIEYIKNL
jgi:hypothetical protein